MSSTERDERRRMATVATERLVDSIGSVLGDRLVSEQGARPDYFNDGVSVDGFSITERCPRRLAHPADDYVDSVATARRRIGLMALRRLGTDHSLGPAGGPLPSAAAGAGAVEPVPIAVAVREVMADPEDWPNRLREWVESLDRAGAAAVSAGATTWCHGALRLVGRHRSIGWVDPSRPSRWNVPGRIVQLRGGVDAVIGSVVRGEKLLLLGDALPGPGDRLRAGYAALLRAVGTTHAPVRVTLGSPATGRMETFPVTAELLELATDRVVEIVGHRVEPDAAPPAPGRWCSHCHLLDVCDEGAAHHAAHSAAHSAAHTAAHTAAGQAARVARVADL